jgi:hypothetical protein
MNSDEQGELKSHNYAFPYVYGNVGNISVLSGDMAWDADRMSLENRFSDPLFLASLDFPGSIFFYAVLPRP